MKRPTLIFGMALVVSIATTVGTASSAIADRAQFKDCKAMHKVFPNGVVRDWERQDSVVAGGFLTPKIIGDDHFSDLQRPPLYTKGYMLRSEILCGIPAGKAAPPAPMDVTARWLLGDEDARVTWRAQDGPYGGIYDFRVSIKGAGQPKITWSKPVGGVRTYTAIVRKPRPNQVFDVYVTASSISGSARSESVSLTR